MTDRSENTDRELWRSLAASREVVPATVAQVSVSDADLAAWLEGRLPEIDAARIDRAMAADPELRRAAFDLSEILGLALPTPPQRLIVRAQALVGYEAERAVPRRGFNALLSSLLRAGFRPQRAATASMAVVLAFMGFMMGGGLGESYAHERQGQSRPATTSPDALSELGDLFNDGS